MTRDSAADERQHATEIPAIERGQARDARDAELENRKAATRPKHSRKLATGDVGLLHVADAEGDRRRIGDAVRNGDSHGVAADEGNVPLLACASDLAADPRASIAPAKSTPRTRAAVPRVALAPRRASSATSAVPVQTSTSVSRPVSFSDAIIASRQRRSMPALRRWFSRSYRGAIASNIPAMRSGVLSGALMGHSINHEDHEGHETIT